MEAQCLTGYGVKGGGILVPGAGHRRVIVDELILIYDEHATSRYNATHILRENHRVSARCTDPRQRTTPQTGDGRRSTQSRFDSILVQESIILSMFSNLNCNCHVV